MEFDPSGPDISLAYTLLAACVNPRPIAWIATFGPEGRVNAAPYSFFNVMGSEPPTLAVGMLSNPGRGLKDTARNIMATGELAVNLAPFPLAEAMNVTAVDAPAGTDELALAGLRAAPSRYVAPPRIAASPVAPECAMLTSLVTGPNQCVVIDRVLSAHVEDTRVTDVARDPVDAGAFDLVGRTRANGCVRTTDGFALTRPVRATFALQDDRRMKSATG